GPHDLVSGITSYLPHLIAYTIVGTADELSQVTRSEVLQFSAGGFRDFTRIAASDPTMWRDVFLANKEAVLEMLGRFNEDLATLARAIRRGDGETLFNQFSRTRAIRRAIVEIGQDSAAPDFGRPHPELPHAPLPRPYAAEDRPAACRLLTASSPVFNGIVPLIRAPIRRHAVVVVNLEFAAAVAPVEFFTGGE